ncbi:MAG: cobyric acid synthase [Desulfobacteraceae bacterium]|nr:cobyric acid synthase [Desulfobacteraceae bacterium]MBC2752674.1 cobyric acid synthase [Desulfobacteraceae bacterium]
MKNKAPARCLAVFGTGSDVGKSVVATGICRALHRQGRHVAPFKAQNMSNNSGVTPEGLEMGRAQIVQAEACHLPPHVDMNPILLKPTSEVGSQVVLLGEARSNQSAVEYHKDKDQLLDVACGALDRLRQTFEAVVIEGAGSCAEVNLAAHDIVNFRIAEHADAPVILVADIHRGGVFAQIIGTLECLEEDQQRRVAGFIVNRFRGDLRLFQDGVDWIEKRTGKPVFGVLPWYRHFVIDQEDSVVIEQPEPVKPVINGHCLVGVIRIPHISNFTDFDPLQAVAGMAAPFLEKVQSLDGFHAIILPGSKNTRSDLNWLHESGWAAAIRRFYASGGHVLGICGGYQMMGRVVFDPDGLEGVPGQTEGLGLLPVETVLQAPKTTTLTRYRWNGVEGRGYEIHMGQTHRVNAEPLMQIIERNGQSCQDEDGCQTDGGQAIGTYIHGLFDTPAMTRKWLAQIGLAHLPVDFPQGPRARHQAYEALADHMERHLDMEAITQLVG